MPKQITEKIIKFFILQNYDIPSDLKELIRTESFKSTTWGYPTEEDINEVTGFIKMMIQEYFKYKTQNVEGQYQDTALKLYFKPIHVLEAQQRNRRKQKMETEKNKK